jgi:baculoviral IAP repeat-containing protein 6
MPQTTCLFKFVKSFEEATFDRLSEFKSIFNTDFNLAKVKIPASYVNKLSEAASSSSTAKSAAGRDASPSGLEAVETVSTLDSFKAFSYPKSISSALQPDFVRRYRAELLTLRRTLIDYNIFVRSCETDITAFKFMIVGPPDTPYAYGCFVFDMKLPEDYPHSPPKVKLRTTGNGTVRFNPNLYNCGKVCLSLLGTWSGEPWDPRESNINQVVMSICYMIFVEHPYFNEPGFAGQQGTKTGDLETFNYNTNIMTSTLRAAVLDHLKSPDSDFGDEIKVIIASNWPRAKQVYESWCDSGRGEGFAASIRLLINDIERSLFPKANSSTLKSSK